MANKQDEECAMDEGGRLSFVSSRRRILGIMLGSLFVTNGGAKGTRLSLDVVLFSYLPRPIIDVHLGKSWVGDAGPYPRSGTGTVTDVGIELGKQDVRWRLDGPKGTPGNGDHITAANVVGLDTVSADSRYSASMSIRTTRSSSSVPSTFPN